MSEEVTVKHVELFFLFVSIYNKDHEDAMNDILNIMFHDSEEDDIVIDPRDILYAHFFASTYHTPSSFEQEALDKTMEILNG